MCDPYPNVCSICHNEGHYELQCPNRPAVKTSWWSRRGSHAKFWLIMIFTSPIPAAMVYWLEQVPEPEIKNAMNLYIVTFFAVAIWVGLVVCGGLAEGAGAEGP